MYAEDDLLPISALQHWAFCPRQCALIHLDHVWAEDARTASGRQLHKRTHQRGAEWKGHVRVVRSLPLTCRALGLVGVADVVEFHPAQADTPSAGQTPVAGLDGQWSVLPVEYKRGRPKRNDCDRLQLCAQGLCLEEMLDVEIPAGQLYYGKQRRRTDVEFTPSLRKRVGDLSDAIRTALAGEALPAPQYSRKCRACSLQTACMPSRIGKGRDLAANYIRRMTRAAMQDHPPEDLP
jgi:CRISPR-associated exonuclease Cas4